MTVLPTLLTPLRLAVKDRTQLALENIVLRQQVAVLKRSVKRPRLRRRGRLFWVLLRRLWSGWSRCLLAVRPATVVAWHQQGWRLLWRRKSRGKPGRQPIALEIRDLIRRLSRENRFWGAPRIQSRAALGPEAGSRMDRLGVAVGSSASPTEPGALCASLDGFSLHAQVHVPADDRERLEHLVRYVCRPACGSRRRLIALISDPPIVRKILRHLGMATEPPALAPPRSPPQMA